MAAAEKARDITHGYSALNNLIQQTLGHCTRSSNELPLEVVHAFHKSVASWSRHIYHINQFIRKQQSDQNGSSNRFMHRAGRGMN